jgi:hypothetical protein
MTCARGRALIAAMLVALAAGDARAQPSATEPSSPSSSSSRPSATRLLIEAGVAADQGDWPTVIARASPVAGDPRQRAADRAEAHRLLGLAAYAQGRLDDADRELFAYLRLDLDGHLDPHLYPPETVAYFESVRARHAGELRALRPRPARTVLVNLLPPFGQLQNGERTKGWIIVGLGGGLLAANLATYAIVKRWCDEDDGTCEVDGRSRRATADRLLQLNRVAGVAAIAVYAYGVIDGFRHYRRRPAVIVTTRASGDGAMLGVAGRW